VKSCSAKLKLTNCIFRDFLLFQKEYNYGSIESIESIYDIVVIRYSRAIKQDVENNLVTASQVEFYEGLRGTN
jgi:hypothetical protein